jgi:hypothetical protein
LQLQALKFGLQSPIAGVVLLLLLLPLLQVPQHELQVVQEDGQQKLLLTVKLPGAKQHKY